MREKRTGSVSLQLGCELVGGMTSMRGNKNAGNSVRRARLLDRDSKCKPPFGAKMHMCKNVKFHRTGGLIVEHQAKKKSQSVKRPSHGSAR